MRFGCSTIVLRTKSHETALDMIAGAGFSWSTWSERATSAAT